MVPNGWSRLKLPEFAWFQEGPGLRNWQFTESGCKVINITNIVDGTLDLSKTDRHISEEELKDKYSHFLCDAGDIVLASSGNSYCKHGIVREQDLPLVMNTSVIRFKALENCDYEFLNQFLKSSYLKKQIDILITGGAQPNFGPVHLKQIELNLPPLPEQQKIATILSTWDKAISTTERLIDNSTQQKKALMQQLLTGKKRLLDESGKRFEKKWEEVELGEISHITTGSSNREDSSLTGEYAFFDRSIDVRTSGIFLFDAEAIIVGGEGQDFVPKYFEGKFDLHQRTYAIMDFKNAYGKFLFYYIGYYRHYFLSQAVGSTVKSLRLPMFQKMPIKLPSVKEQQKIATVLTNADKEIELLEQQLADLQQEKKALMQVLLTGKVRVLV